VNAVTASPDDVGAWLLAMDADTVPDGLARLDALIAECETAFDALIHLPLDLEWVPDPTLPAKARTARQLVQEIRDDLTASRRRLDA
jgi:hypothetical protein